MNGEDKWKCITCTLENPLKARKCGACEQPRRRTSRSRVTDPSIVLAEDRAYAACEEIVVKYTNPHQNSFDVIAIVPVESARRDDHWPVPGVTNNHWKYIGDNNNKWNNCLRKEPVEGVVRFEANLFEPGEYQVQLRFYNNGNWSNVQKRIRLDIAPTVAEARRIAPPSLNPLPSQDTNDFPPKKRHRALVGLQNIGNTCYMNAAVQCLASLTPLMDAFLARNPGPDPPSLGWSSFYSLDRKTSDYHVPLESPKLRAHRQPAKIEPQVELNDGEWRCTACTLTNKQGDIRCQLCGKLAGREIREQIRKQDGENVPSVSPNKKHYGTSDDIFVSFKDPLARPYTVICIVPNTIPNFGAGIWPIPRWDAPGATWRYTDASGDSGVVGSFEGDVKFHPKRLGGGRFQVQLRYYIAGSWAKVEAFAEIEIEGEPLRLKNRKRAIVGPSIVNGTTASATSPSNATSTSDEGKLPSSGAQISPSPPPKPPPKPIDTAVKNSIETSRPKPLKPGVLSEEFTRLIHILSNFEIDGKYICPEYLKALIEHVRPEFKGTNQHDCQEFIQALLDELNLDLKRIEKSKPRRKRKLTSASKKARKRKPSDPLEHEAPTVRALAMWEKLRRPKGSLISEMFFGMLENRVECQTCFNRSTVYSTFSTVSLDIPTTNHHNHQKNGNSSGNSSSKKKKNTTMNASSSSSSIQPNFDFQPSRVSKRNKHGPLADRAPRRPRLRGRGKQRERGKNYAGSMDSTDYEDDTTNLKTLDECFRAFTEEERLSGCNAYFCSRCKKRGEATKKMMFYHLPPVLIVHLKRFTADGSGKADAQISFPNELDLSQYCLRSRKNFASQEYSTSAAAAAGKGEASRPGVEDCRYRLVGVVNHQQNDGYKHYTALTLAKLNGKKKSPLSSKQEQNQGSDSDSKGVVIENLKKVTGTNGEGQPYFGRMYEKDHAGWVEFDDEKAWHLSTHEARSERARQRTRREAYLLFYEAAKI